MTTYGAIDLGTNSVRLLIGRVHEGELAILETGLITTRLGENMWERPLLTAGAIERTLVALAQFKAQLEQYRVEQVRVVATSAVRDSSNQDELVDLVKEQLGLTVDVITGEEEAWLGYQGVLWGTKELENSRGEEPILVLDIGGGSTEFIYQQEEELVAASINLGAVRLHGKPMASKDIVELMEPIVTKVKALPGEMKLVGVGGTITTAVAIKEKLTQYQRDLVHGQQLTKAEVETMVKLLSSMTLEQRKQVPGLQPERADIIGAGLNILVHAMEALDKDVITVSEADMLYGIIAQMTIFSSQQPF